MRKAAALAVITLAVLLHGCKSEDQAQAASTAATDAKPAEQSEPEHYKMPLPKGETIISCSNSENNVFVVSKEADGTQHYRCWNWKGQLQWEVTFGE